MNKIPAGGLHSKSWDEFSGPGARLWISYLFYVIKATSKNVPFRRATLSENCCHSHPERCGLGVRC
jgi:hypothetical protein